MLRFPAIAAVPVIVALTLGAVQNVAAQGVGPGSPTDTSHLFNPDGTWYIGGPNDPGNNGMPYPVSLDPNGPMWRKTLFGSPDGPTGGPGVLHVHEVIQIVPIPGVPIFPWADWHEIIHTPGWGWGDAMIWFAGDPTMAPIPGLTFMIGDDGRSIWFDFDPIFPDPTQPIVIEIWKDLIWLGPEPYIPGMPIEVWEYPTPAPGTGVAALAACGLVTLRRRR